MIDYSVMPLGVDLSHWNGTIDFDLLQAAKVEFVYAKISEGMTIDAQFERNRREAHGRDMPFMCYPFIRASDTAAIINHTLSVANGEVICLDWEAQGISTNVVERWMDAYATKAGRAGMVYYGKWPPAPASAKIGGWPRLFPQYPSSLTADLLLPPCSGAGLLEDIDWRYQYLINQFTDRLHIKGLSGGVDGNRCACPIDVLRHWIDTGDLVNWAFGPTKPKETLLGPRVLKLYTSGEDVRELQTRLLDAGFDPGPADAAFGTDTRAAVKAFQTRYNLTIDGIAYRETFAALLAL